MFFKKSNCPKCKIAVETRCIDGWKHQFSSLPGWNENARYVLFENTLGDTACLLYGIYEVRMCHEVGNLAIFRNKINPELLFAHSAMLYPPNAVCFDTLASRGFIFCKAYILWQQSIFIFDLFNNRYALYDLQTPNPIYSINQNSNGDVIFKPDAYQAEHDKTLHGMEKLVIRLDAVEWFDLNNLDIFCRKRWGKLMKLHDPQQYQYNVSRGVEPKTSLFVKL